MTSFTKLNIVFNYKLTTLIKDVFFRQAMAFRPNGIDSLCVPRGIKAYLNYEL